MELVSLEKTITYGVNPT